MKTILKISLSVIFLLILFIIISNIYNNSKKCKKESLSLPQTKNFFYKYPDHLDDPQEYKTPEVYTSNDYIMCLLGSIQGNSEITDYLGGNSSWNIIVNPGGYNESVKPFIAPFFPKLISSKIDIKNNKNIFDPPSEIFKTGNNWTDPNKNYGILDYNTLSMILKFSAYDIVINDCIININSITNLYYQYYIKKQEIITTNNDPDILGCRTSDQSINNCPSNDLEYVSTLNTIDINSESRNNVGRTTLSMYLYNLIDKINKPPSICPKGSLNNLINYFLNIPDSSTIGATGANYMWQNSISKDADPDPMRSRSFYVYAFLLGLGLNMYQELTVVDNSFFQGSYYKPWENLEVITKMRQFVYNYLPYLKVMAEQIYLIIAKSIEYTLTPNDDNSVYVSLKIPYISGRVKQPKEFTFYFPNDIKKLDKNNTMLNCLRTYYQEKTNSIDGLAKNFCEEMKSVKYSTITDFINTKQDRSGFVQCPPPRDFHKYFPYKGMMFPSNEEELKNTWLLLNTRVSGLGDLFAGRDLFNDPNYPAGNAVTGSIYKSINEFVKEIFGADPREIVESFEKIAGINSNRNTFNWGSIDYNLGNVLSTASYSGSFSDLYRGPKKINGKLNCTKPQPTQSMTELSFADDDPYKTFPFGINAPSWGDLINQNFGFNYNCDTKINMYDHNPSISCATGYGQFGSGGDCCPYDENKKIFTQTCHNNYVGYDVENRQMEMCLLNMPLPVIDLITNPSFINETFTLNQLPPISGQTKNSLNYGTSYSKIYKEINSDTQYVYVKFPITTYDGIYKITFITSGFSFRKINDRDIIDKNKIERQYPITYGYSQNNTPSSAAAYQYINANFNGGEVLSSEITNIIGGAKILRKIDLSNINVIPFESGKFKLSQQDATKLNVNSYTRMVEVVSCKYGDDNCSTGKYSVIFNGGNFIFSKIETYEGFAEIINVPVNYNNFSNLDNVYKNNDAIFFGKNFNFGIISQKIALIRSCSSYILNFKLIVNNPNSYFNYFFSFTDASGKILGEIGTPFGDPANLIAITTGTQYTYTTIFDTSSATQCAIYFNGYYNGDIYDIFGPILTELTIKGNTTTSIINVPNNSIWNIISTPGYGNPVITNNNITFNSLNGDSKVTKTINLENSCSSYEINLYISLMNTRYLGSNAPTAGSFLFKAVFYDVNNNIINTVMAGNVDNYYISIPYQMGDKLYTFSTNVNTSLAVKCVVTLGGKNMLPDNSTTEGGPIIKFAPLKGTLSSTQIVTTPVQVTTPQSPIAPIFSTIIQTNNNPYVNIRSWSSSPGGFGDKNDDSSVNPAIDSSGIFFSKTKSQVFKFVDLSTIRCSSYTFSFDIATYDNNSSFSVYLAFYDSTMNKPIGGVGDANYIKLPSISNTRKSYTTNFDTSSVVGCDLRFVGDNNTRTGFWGPVISNIKITGIIEPLIIPINLSNSMIEYGNFDNGTATSGYPYISNNTLYFSTKNPIVVQLIYLPLCSSYKLSFDLTTNYLGSKFSASMVFYDLKFNITGYLVSNFPTIIEKSFKKTYTFETNFNTNTSTMCYLVFKGSNKIINISGTFTGPIVSNIIFSGPDPKISLSEATPTTTPIQITTTPITTTPIQITTTPIATTTPTPTPTPTTKPIILPSYTQLNFSDPSKLDYIDPYSHYQKYGKKFGYEWRGDEMTKYIIQPEADIIISISNNDMTKYLSFDNFSAGSQIVLNTCCTRFLGHQVSLGNYIFKIFGYNKTFDKNVSLFINIDSNNKLILSSTPYVFSLSELNNKTYTIRGSTLVYEKTTTPVQVTTPVQITTPVQVTTPASTTPLVITTPSPMISNNLITNYNSFLTFQPRIDAERGDVNTFDSGYGISGSPIIQNNTIKFSRRYAEVYFTGNLDSNLLSCDFSFDLLSTYGGNFYAYIEFFGSARIIKWIGTNSTDANILMPLQNSNTITKLKYTSTFDVINTEPNTSEWVQLINKENGNLYYWNKTTNETIFKLQTPDTYTGGFRIHFGGQTTTTKTDYGFFGPQVSNVNVIPTYKFPKAPLPPTNLVLNSNFSSLLSWTSYPSLLVNSNIGFDDSPYIWNNSLTFSSSRFCIVSQSIILNNNFNTYKFNYKLLTSANNKEVGNYYAKAVFLDSKKNIITTIGLISVQTFTSTTLTTKFEYTSNINTSSATLCKIKIYGIRNTDYLRITDVTLKGYNIFNVQPFVLTTPPPENTQVPITVSINNNNWAGFLSPPYDTDYNPYIQQEGIYINNNILNFTTVESYVSQKIYLNNSNAYKFSFKLNGNTGVNFEGNLLASVAFFKRDGSLINLIGTSNYFALSTITQINTNEFFYIMSDLDNNNFSDPNLSIVRKDQRSYKTNNPVTYNTYSNSTDAAYCIIIIGGYLNHYQTQFSISNISLQTTSYNITTPVQAPDQILPEANFVTRSSYFMSENTNIIGSECNIYTNITHQECQDMCDYNSDCIAYLVDNSKNCYLKNGYDEIVNNETTTAFIKILEKQMHVPNNLYWNIQNTNNNISVANTTTPSSFNIIDNYLFDSNVYYKIYSILKESDSPFFQAREIKLYFDMNFNRTDFSHCGKELIGVIPNYILTSYYPLYNGSDIKQIDTFFNIFTNTTLPNVERGSNYYINCGNAFKGVTNELYPKFNLSNNLNYDINHLKSTDSVSYENLQNKSSLKLLGINPTYYQSLNNDDKLYLFNLEQLVDGSYLISAPNSKSIDNMYYYYQMTTIPGPLSDLAGCNLRDGAPSIRQNEYYVITQGYNRQQALTNIEAHFYFEININAFDYFEQ